MQKNRKKVLAILKVAPPLTGATAINQSIVDSQIKWPNGILDFKTISYANSIQDLGSLKWTKFLKFFTFFFSILFQIIREKIDLLYFQMSIYGASFYRDSTLLLVSKIFRKKVLVHLHGKGLKAYGERHAFYRFWIKWLLKDQSAIVLTESQKQDVLWIGFKEIFVIPNGIDYPKEMQKDWRVHHRDGPIRWLFLSNMLESKGIADALALALLLKKNDIPFHVDLIGKEGDYNSQRIGQFIHENELDCQMVYHGPRYGEEKWSAIVSSDVLVFPTYNEAFGIVAIEAMAMGIPVIAYKEGGLPEVIKPGINGVLVDKGDLDGLYAALVRFQQNPDEMQALGMGARQLFLSKFTSHTFITTLYATFDRVLAHKQ